MLYIPGDLQSMQTTSCKLSESWNSPFNESKDGFNPCFIIFLSFLINGVIGVFALYEAQQLLFNNTFGLSKIKYKFGYYFKLKSVGICQLIKLNSIFLQVIISGFLTSVNFNSFSDFKSLTILFQTILTLCLILPLHVIEPTRSAIPLASLLFYWLFSFCVNIFIFANDAFFPSKIYVPSTSEELSVLGFTFEAVLTLNSGIIFAFEYFLYRPSVELTEYFELNDWDITCLRDYISDLLFTWVQPVIRSIYETNEIDLKDVPSQNVDLTCDYAYTRFKKNWENAVEKAKVKRAKRLKKISNPTEEDKKLKVSLLYVLASTYGLDIINTVLLDTLSLFVEFTQPFLLQQLIMFFDTYNSSSESTNHSIAGYTIAVSMFLVSIVRFIASNRYYIVGFRADRSVEASLTSMVYEKGMKLSPEERKNKSTGDIVNNLAVDVSLVSSLPFNFNDVLSCPIRLVLALMALYKILGNATFAGVATTIVSVPLTMTLSSKIFGLYNLNMEYKDARTRLTSDILNSIKSIKLYSWEEPMLERLSEIRNDKELITSKQIGIFNSFISFLWACVPYLISSACLIAYITLGGNILIPSVAFPALSLFDVVASPIQILPNAITSLFETKVSLDRLSEFFLTNELSTDYVERSNDSLKSNDTSVIAKNATFLWSPKKEVFGRDEESDIQSDFNNVALTDIDFSARKGELTCIVGRVGSGKSTLLRALLGEVPLVRSEGTILKINGSVAYCPQTPWILNGSVKENILFGYKYDKEFYQLTVESCQLSSDFDMLPDGDRTIVGEKGISLSGGQKARVALARAVYARSDVYLLDDVLSAVDAHVGKNMIAQVLGPKGLLASKTIILATNSINVLHNAKEIVLLKSGAIIERGSFDEVMARDSELTNLLTEFSSATKNISEQSIEPSNSDEESENIDQEPKPFLPTEDEDLALVRVATHHTLGASSVASLGHEYTEEELGDDSIVKRTGLTVEQETKGKVRLGVYLEFFKACNYRYVIFFLICTAGQISGTIFCSYAIKTWSEKNAIAGENINPFFYLTLYVCICVCSSALVLIGSVVVWSFCVIGSSSYFHDKMARSVMRSPMSFFDTTPIGRILNRFSGDINVIDKQLIWSFMAFLEYSFHAIGLLAVISYNLPIMLLVIFILFFVYNNVRLEFIPASRELKRLSSTRRSPIFSHLQESINGVEVIRAFGQEERFMHKNTYNIDMRNKVLNINCCCSRWLSIRLQTISSIIVFSTALLSLASLGSKHEIGSAMLGFVMLQSLSITSMLAYITRCWADIETKSISVERIVEYCNLKPEAKFVIEDSRPKDSWPEAGALEFKNYSTRYRENLDPVLKNISLKIKSKEKIGVVGRTGAGKSSLTLAIFRLIEPIEGHIEIDHVNTSGLGLFDLRRHLNIIPQDSSTVEGTIRENLDPFRKYTDEQLWKVLELAHLKDHIEQMKTEKKNPKEDAKGPKKLNDESEAEDEFDTGLNAKVFDNGSNLSSGQKQLLSLARALLNPSKVLILDEATAAVDVQTDKIVQAAIRSQFKDKTILTIAHRIDTIIDSDRILVLDKGTVKQFDSPANLLNDEDGIFYSLCKEGGYLDLFRQNKSELPKRFK